MENDAATVLVVGATGALGSVVAGKLSAAGRNVRAGSRNPDRIEQSHVHPVRVDIRNPEQVQEAVTGAQVVVSSLHGLAPPTRNNHPGIVDGTGVKALIGRARDAGIEHFVLISAQGAAADGPSRFLRLKHESEVALRASGIGYTILRPPAFMEVHALRFMGEPMRAGKPVPFVGSGHVPIEWISTRDVSDAVVESIGNASRRNTTIALKGAETMSRLEALEVLEEALGREARRRHLPRSVATVMKSVGGLLNPGLGYLLEMALAEGRPPGTSTPPDMEIRGIVTLGEVAAAWATPQETAPRPG